MITFKSQMITLECKVIIKNLEETVKHNSIKPSRLPRSNFPPTSSEDQKKNFYASDAQFYPKRRVNTNIIQHNKKRSFIRDYLNEYKLVSCIFILLSRESDQCAIRARLGVASHLSTTPRWGNPAKCLSQRHNK